MWQLAQCTHMKKPWTYVYAVIVLVRKKRREEKKSLHWQTRERDSVSVKTRKKNCCTLGHRRLWTDGCIRFSWQTSECRERKWVSVEETKKKRKNSVKCCRAYIYTSNRWTSTDWLSKERKKERKNSRLCFASKRSTQANRTSARVCVCLNTYFFILFVWYIY
jgi:hypothetical protein